MDDLVMDLLRVLSSPDLDVRRKALDIAAEMVNSRNVEEVIGLLKKELTHTLEGQTYDRMIEYRQLLVRHIHACAVRFPNVAADAVRVLLLVLVEVPTSSNGSASSSTTSSGGVTALGDSSAVADVISFIKQVLERFPSLRPEITQKLLEIFGIVRSSRILRGSLWMLGEYCEDTKSIKAAWSVIREALGELPLLASEQREADAQGSDEPSQDDTNPAPSKPRPSTAPKVLADGTYATESAFTQDGDSSSSSATSSAAYKQGLKDKPVIRSLLLQGDYFLGTILASTLTKLVLRFHALGGGVAEMNGLRAEAMLIQTGIIRIGRSRFATSPIDEDATERVMTCLRVLDNLSPTSPASSMGKSAMEQAFLEDCHNAFVHIIQEEEEEKRRKKEIGELDGGRGKEGWVGVEETIGFRQFASPTTSASADEPESFMAGGTGADAYEKDLMKATGAEQEDGVVNKLNRVVQLTGFSDTVYAEAYVNVHQYDILLDVLVVNQTSETLRNLTIEFATLGDLRLVEKPGQHNVGPRGVLSIKAGIKVSSTETGVIFGNIVYDAAGAASSDGQHFVIMNDIHIDIMDYIRPGSFSEQQVGHRSTRFDSSFWEER